MFQPTTTVHLCKSTRMMAFVNFCRVFSIRFALYYFIYGWPSSIMLRFTIIYVCASKQERAIICVLPSAVRVAHCYFWYPLLKRTVRFAMRKWCIVGLCFQDFLIFYKIFSHVRLHKTKGHRLNDFLVIRHYNSQIISFDMCGVMCYESHAVKKPSNVLCTKMDILFLRDR